MFRNRFLLIPFVIFLISFGIDKLISSTIFEPYYSLSLSDLNFKHKEFLFEELKDYLKKKDRKKVLVYFGNSRALLFRNDYIEKNIRIGFCSIFPFPEDLPIIICIGWKGFSLMV
ncbi:PF07611 domain protein [Leptospira interrogans serovar Pyrogenes str. L0374]|uniref:PF07611 domain protein n=5 Tax=Leptospira interrogans TaxID=173 RepID=M6ZQU4_LEPIR|nr:PF07611 domain protein [Leptospira interrogans serovar Copenhageni str. LT2050]EMM83960.1 PF07611 domain protein [Leptospira interrogans str. 2006001854]EMM96552.1 PF07611 domain protein [Leptospira interrogans serovar Zanoni str. LT2156]EMN30955.1 PF07611 domain protein [Leptospira interrogans serovar Pyrogenes str. L0374]EMP08441.1 PF07611 domain protein [Leptospira interrogans serovar Pyrogenes str. 200701872]